MCTHLKAVRFVPLRCACSDRMPLSRHPLVEITHRLLCCLKSQRGDASRAMRSIYTQRQPSKHGKKCTITVMLMHRNAVMATHPSQYLGPGPLRPAISAGFARLQRSIDRQPQPMHSVSPDLRRCNSAMRWSMRLVHRPDKRDQSRRDGTRSAGNLASSAPISSSVSPIRCAKTMKAIRRSTERG